MTMADAGVVLGAIAAVIGGAWAVLLWYEKKLDARFEEQEKRRVEARNQFDARFERLEAADRVHERNHLELMARLPIDYVRREDFVRNQTIIEAKLDALAVRFENAMLRGKG